MLLHRLSAIGLASLALLHPAAKHLDINWEQALLNKDLNPGAAEAEMCANTYHNGVLFGLWAAGVAISVGRLLTYIILGNKGVKDAETQTNVEHEVVETDEEYVDTEQDSPIIQEPEPESTSETKIEEAKPSEKATASVDIKEIITPGLLDEEKQDVPKVIAELDKKTEEKEEDKQHVEEGDNGKDEEKNKEMKVGERLSVYKLPSIKRHHFLIRQDGMRVLRQAVAGDFSLEKVTVDGIRNFIFLVAKGSSSQLDELASKIKSDFRWLTPVRDPSPRLTRSFLANEPEQPAPTVHHEAARLPTRKSPLPRVASLSVRPGLAHKPPASKQ